MTGVLVIALSTTASGAAGAGTSSADSRAQGVLTAARVSAPVKCGAHRAVRFYSRRLNEHRARMGAARVSTSHGDNRVGCPRYLAHVLQRKARAWRKRAEAWVEYHYAWRKWLPDKWARIGACETGYGRRPGQWTWNSGTYQGAFGFYHGTWDQYKPAGAPSEAYLATPRQQYQCALNVYAAHGYGAWGCGGA